MTATPYDNEHRKAARACIAAQPWCSWCGTTQDLCADHIIAGHPERGYRTLCRPCNSKRRAGATGPTTTTNRSRT